MVERDVDGALPRVVFLTAAAFLPNHPLLGKCCHIHNPPTQMWPLLPAMLERNLYSHVCFHGAQMSVLCVFKAELLLAMTRIQMLLLSVGPFSSLEH